ncbi:MAG TPA: isoprenylcysteine carboxylmethyltransferase family protein [Terriglobales bacterium]|nr:isoprenylcysteine carboxylmethyltransferase family protein [Terriglobales bacterium]
MNESPAKPSFLRFLAIQGVLVFLLFYGVISFVRGAWDVTRWIGLGLMIAGAVLFFTARLQLGNSFAVRAEARQLVTTGLYSRIRNPIYVFSGVMILGFLTVLRRPILFLILPVLVTAQILRSRKEAQVLEAKFGDQYRAYRQKTWF